MPLLLVVSQLIAHWQILAHGRKKAQGVSYRKVREQPQTEVNQGLCQEDKPVSPYCTRTEMMCMMQCTYAARYMQGPTS